MTTVSWRSGSRASPKLASAQGMWWLVCCGVVIGIVSSALTSLILIQPGPLVAPSVLTVADASGASLIASQLAEHRVINSPWLFILATRLSGTADELQAGEYRFVPRESMLEVILKLRRGETVVHRLTIPEGSNTRTVVALLNQRPQLVGPMVPLQEGTLMPDTYLFTQGTTRAQLIAQMQRAQKQFLDARWLQREVTLPLATPYQALILASIVEKEAAVQQARVAGVFINRLRVGMPLQADATVIYARGQDSAGQPLSRNDLAMESPYNTYFRRGLPPHPITNPGRAAIMAVLHPEEHDYFYFVADGRGGHVFATTLTEHHRNVSCWRTTGFSCHPED